MPVHSHTTQNISEMTTHILDIAVCLTSSEQLNCWCYGKELHWVYARIQQQRYTHYSNKLNPSYHYRFQMYSLCPTFLSSSLCPTFLSSNFFFLRGLQLLKVDTEPINDPLWLTPMNCQSACGSLVMLNLLCCKKVICMLGVLRNQTGFNTTSDKQKIDISLNIILGSSLPQD